MASRETSIRWLGECWKSLSSDSAISENEDVLRWFCFVRLHRARSESFRFLKRRIGAVMIGFFLLQRQEKSAVFDKRELFYVQHLVLGSATTT